RRRLELPLVGVFPGHGTATEVSRGAAPAHAGVVVRLVGEVRAAVALPTARLALVQPQAVPLRRRQRVVLALAAEAVHPAVAAQQYTLETCQRLRQVVRRHAVVERRRERGSIVRALLQPLDGS